MRKSAWKWLLVGSALTVLLLYVIEITTSGIERVYGPLEGQITSTSYVNTSQEKPTETESNSSISMTNEESTTINEEIAKLEQDILELKKQALLQEKENLEQPPLLLNEVVDEPAVNRLADSTSGVLQNASSSSLQFIAEMFSNVIN